MGEQGAGEDTAMQFHTNGFRTGDPSKADPLPGAEQQDCDQLPAQADVLIVGCGPAGLCLAAQLAQFPGVSTCIIDQKPGPLELGQADGIACRTMEMFQAFGFCEQVMREAYWVNETCFWKPDPDAPANIIRSGRVQDVEDGLSELPHVILNQARVHQFFLQVMANSPHRLTPRYNRRFVAIREGDQDGPVTVEIERLTIDGSTVRETIRARYLIGCDGARSQVRRAIGQQLEGDAANQAWGVMDVLAETDFPDIRLKTLIQSHDQGSIVIIPREGGHLVRFYVELDQLNPDERVATRDLQVDDLIAAVNRIIHPHRLDVREVAWWSVYEIGQRLCARFDDLQANEPPDCTPRIFIAGDACHTHSPKAGQGMNVSMQDAFNLGWKLGTVLEGRAPPDLLKTYNDERQAIAAELIDFDREWAALLSAASHGGPDAVDAAEVQRYFVQHGRYTAGTATRYAPAMLTAPPDHQHLAAGFQIGTRFHSAPVVRLGDARPMQLGHAATADGRWRLYLFANQDDPHDPQSALHQYGAFLANDASSPVRLFTPAAADRDAVIDVRAILQTSHREVDIAGMPAFLKPRVGRHQLIDYEKIFCPDLRAGQDIFELRQINRETGVAVLVRPDQYVALITSLSDRTDLTAFFDRFLHRLE